MRRVVSLYLPTWPTDRLKRQGVSPEGPLVTATHDGRRRIIAAVDEAAARAGLRPGMPLAQAQTLEPGLVVREARAEDDVAALARLAGWCLRYAPLTAAAPPDGVWIDVTGSTHLHGGETRLSRDLVGRLRDQGFAARAAVADTPGAAHALARFGAEPVAVVPPDGQDAALAPLPLAALRLPEAALDGLRLMGIERIGALAALPRAPLARRFGAGVIERLDQALGSVPEPISPIFPPELIQARLSFVEPLLTPEAFAHVIARLAETVCAALDHAGRGARRLDLVFERVDGSTQALRVGTARASRDARHLTRLLQERLERIDPGLGVEAMRLLVPRTDPMVPAQHDLSRPEEPDIAPLIDRLSNRFGPAHVYRVAPVASAVPERSVARVPGQRFSARVPGQSSAAWGPGQDFTAQTPGRGSIPQAPDQDSAARIPAQGSVIQALGRGAVAQVVGQNSAAPSPRRGPIVRSLGQGSAAPVSGAPQPPIAATWPAGTPRPVRLLDPPQPVDAMALLPDHPPLAFTWRRVRHRVRRADGPERIAGEWWKRDGETRSVRDYFRVEDEEGRRFWLFRRGDGENSVSGDLRWFLHGFF
jgi:protein ImuB